MKPKISKTEFILNKTKPNLRLWNKEGKYYQVVKYIDGERIEMHLTNSDYLRAHKSIGLIASLKSLMNLLSDHKYHSFSVRHSAFGRSFELRLKENNKEIYYQDMCDGEDYYIPVDDIKDYPIYQDLIGGAIYDDKLFLKHLHSLRNDK